MTMAMVVPPPQTPPDAREALAPPPPTVGAEGLRALSRETLERELLRAREQVSATTTRNTPGLPYGLSTAPSSGECIRCWPLM